MWSVCVCVCVERVGRVQARQEAFCFVPGVRYYRRLGTLLINSSILLIPPTLLRRLGIVDVIKLTFEVYSMSRRFHIGYKVYIGVALQNKSWSMGTPEKAAQHPLLEPL